MDKYVIKKTRCLFAIMLLLCVNCNANSNCCHVKCVDNDLLCMHSDSVNKQSKLQNKCCCSIMLDCKLHAEKNDSVQCISCFNDSIINIIKKSRRIVCMLGVRNPQDSVRLDTIRVLPYKLKIVLKYLLSDFDNYKSNDIVYGNFSSTVCYKFYKSKKNFVYVKLDFGLRKMQILDMNEKLLCAYDIKENNLQLLRFTRTLFPHDLTLRMLQNNLKYQ